ncbi:MAG TPA: SAM-dependent chlorinase/fluorinase [Candidatus Bathyarchaeia archaeon]|nr:SAM-dependent chlorinase/fluorinase [Candidatus Bathyarchaeia archaeon]
MPRSIVTLTTDFGLRDSYVAEMKAVILSINPSTVIVDVSNEIEKFNIRMGAYTLACAAPYFPTGTIHVAVVDPNVGTKRKAILVQTERAYFIGPDNGILALAARNQSIRHVYEVSNRKLMLSKVSGTFHGRDIFAPAAAYLANGVPPEDFGTELREIEKPAFANVIRQTNRLIGEVVHIDGFGNVITSFLVEDVESMKAKAVVNIKLNDVRFKLRLCETYADAKKQELFAIIGSHGFLEISANKGNAAQKFKVKSGDKISLLTP